MKTFEIYLPSKEPVELDSAVFIKQGFSFSAALFQFLWCAYHRLWLAALCLFALSMVLTSLQEGSLISENFNESFAIALFLFVGFEANEWRVAILKKRGYVLKEVILANSLEEAQKQFYTGQLSAEEPLLHLKTT